MININGHWENVNTLQDVVRIIREYYNEELANKTDELLEQLVNAFEDRIEEVSWCNTDYTDDWCDE